jgi:replicative DNA helicase
MGIETGFRDIDNITGVLADLICISSRPAVGKTTLALNIANNVVKQQKSTLIFSLDNSKDLIKNKIINIETTNSSDFLKTAKYLLEFEEQLYIYDNVLSIEGIEQTARKVKLQENIGLIIIDYLQLIKFERTLEEVIIRLKTLAKELNIPIIVLSQLSKELESREDKRPILADFKSSSAIVDYADTIMFIYRDDYYNKDSERKNIVDVIVAKTNRNITGTAELLNIRNKYVDIERYRKKE